MNKKNIAADIHRLLEGFFSRKSGVFEKSIGASVAALKAGKKILAFGNGGSAAEAQHFVAEIVNKFLKMRPALRAVALTTDTSVLTSIGNDIAFDALFSRQIEALGDSGDIAVALSTSGNSPNITKALEAAKDKGLATIGFSGEGGGKMAAFCDYLLDVPSTSTPRIQEVHLVLLHILAEEIENRFFI